jgi:hypothetical protein
LALMPANPSLWLTDPERYLEPTRLAGERSRMRRQARYNAVAALIAAHRAEYDALHATETAKGEAWLAAQIRRAEQRAEGLAS